MYYLCSEDNGADHLCDYSVADLCLWFDAVQRGFTILLVRPLFSSPLSRSLRGELIGWNCAGVRPLANCNRTTAIGFGPDRIRTLVSMAADSSRRVIMDIFTTVFLSKQVTRTCIKAWMCLKLGCV